MESDDEILSKRKGAHDMRVAGLVIGLSMVFALLLSVLIIVFGHIKLN